MVNYFEFYGLPLSFHPDAGLVKQKFYALSKQYHPDFYINESEEKQAEVLEMSTQNNKAYQVLADPQRRMQYILELKGLIEEGESYALPQSFLMDMMEVNEVLMELQFEPDASRLSSLKAEFSAIEEGMAKEVAALTQEFELKPESEQQLSLLALKDFYYRNKYLLRIREGLVKASAETN